MVWTDWWPHDRVPQPEGANPYRVYCEANKVYWWCSCGKCKTQPWCDIKNRAASGCKPVMYIPKLTGWKLLSGSKFTELPPFSVGTHFWVKCQNNTPLASVCTFAMAFSFGVFSTYLMHG